MGERIEVDNVNDQGQTTIIGPKVVVRQGILQGWSGVK